jgi:hypothetical protein
LLTASTAWADDDLGSAREHFKKGKRAYDVGHFADAAREYEQAYQAKDDPALLYNLGQAHRLAGHPGEALLAYKAYLRNLPDATNRAEVEQRIRELQIVVDKLPKPVPAATPTAPHATPDAPADGSTIRSTAPTTTPAPVTATTAERPLYKRPWLWAVVAGGAVAVAAGVTLAVVLGSPAKDPTPSLGMASARGF